MQFELELVENLLKRIENSPRGTGYTLEGMITDSELAALHQLLKTARSDSSSTGTPFTPAAPNIIGSVSLNQSSLTKKVDDTTILCLDFGTAFSKAAATDASDKLLDIDLNKLPRVDNQSYRLDSSIFIDGDRIWFGAQAIEKSAGEDPLGRSRFDSPKQEMSQGDLKRLDAERVDRSINPSAIPFSKGDLIQLYLAYLADATSTELMAQGVSDLPKQRFARPCWPQDRAKLADVAFQRMLARGQIIGDTLHGAWAEGVRVKTARSVLDAAAGLESLPKHVETAGVMEATAAASSALKGLPSESLFLVVDIGAGTCDFGLFFVRGGERVAELTGTTQVLRQAGDRIDGFLVNALLEKAHVDSGSDEGRRMSQDLARDRRRLKEALFLNSQVSRTLENDATVDIALDEFSDRPDVAGFVRTFTAQLAKCLGAPKPGTYRRTDGNIDVVLTGGGSDLPFLRSVFDQPMTLDGHGTVRFRRRASAPGWLAAYPRLQPYFPQLAVAIGGAQEWLPAQKSEVSDMTLPEPGPRTMAPVYRS